MTSKIIADEVARQIKACKTIDEAYCKVATEIGCSKRQVVEAYLEEIMIPKLNAWQAGGQLQNKGTKHD